MAKSANVYARIEPELKRQAEDILDALGIPASNAVTMFYKQIVLQKGLPFDVKLPSTSLNFSLLTEKERNEELNLGYQEMLAGKSLPVADAFSEVRKGLGL